MTDVDDLRNNLKALTAESDALVDLIIGLHHSLKGAVARLEALEAAPSAIRPLDLSNYRAPAIAAAVLALRDRRAALVRTEVNRGLAARTGRRGRCTSQDRVAAPAGNRRVNGQLEPSL